MMNQPLNALAHQPGGRHMLVTAVAQRARQLQANPDKLGDRKPVSVAVDELYHDELTLDYPKDFAQQG